MAMSFSHTREFQCIIINYATIIIYAINFDITLKGMFEENNSNKL